MSGPGNVAGGRAALRLLRFAKNHGPCLCAPMVGGQGGHVLVTGKGGKQYLSSEETIRMLVCEELLKDTGGRLQLTGLGEKRLKRLAGADLDDPGGFAGQHRTLESREISIEGAAHWVTINTDESPLARLRTRQDGHGRPWIDDTAYEAGERLRRDFTIGGLMQKVTASWDAAIGSAGRKAGSGGKVDLTDSAIDARRRLDDALDIVGPDLAGVLTDFCCFLKGLESIERDRKWPPRSAKLMLRTGLELLARFYGLEARGPARGRVQSWGGEGYRPQIGG